jgi:hypothetical protein
MPIILKDVLVVKTVYSEETNDGILMKYMTDCIAAGKASVLYKDPAISIAFYDLGILAAGAIQTAITAYGLAPTKGNLGIIKDKMALGVIWLDGYVAKVIPIANADTNRTTRLEAETNIKISFLTPFKLDNSVKPAPDDPIITGLNVGTSEVDISVINGGKYSPTKITFVAVQDAPVTEPPTPEPIILLENGLLSVQFFGPGMVIIQTVNGKGRLTKFKSLVAGGWYTFVAFAQNSKAKISKLSNFLHLRG